MTSTTEPLGGFYLSKLPRGIQERLEEIQLAIIWWIRKGYKGINLRFLSSCLLSINRQNQLCEVGPYSSRTMNVATGMEIGTVDLADGNSKDHRRKQSGATRRILCHVPQSYQDSNHGRRSSLGVRETYCFRRAAIWTFAQSYIIRIPPVGLPLLP